MLFTPALTDKLLACCSNDMLTCAHAAGRQRGTSSAAEAEFEGVLPRGLPFVYVQTAEHRSDRQRDAATRGHRAGVFGGIAGIAVAPHRRTGDQPPASASGPRSRHRPRPRGRPVHDPLRRSARHAGRRARRLASWPASWRLGLSPLAPLGPVRPFLRAAVHADWTVIGVGRGGLTAHARRRRRGGLGSARSPTGAAPGSPRVAPLVGDDGVPSGRGLPPAAVTGVRFALEPGAGRTAVPVRSAILGAILAVTVVVATVTFGSSLNTLVSHPALYGWNWTYDMDGGGGLGDIPAAPAAKLLDADPLVSRWTGISTRRCSSTGVSVPVMGSTPHAAVGAARPQRTRALLAANQVVLGGSTLRQLHKQVGDTVEAQAHGGSPGHPHHCGHGHAAADRRAGLLPPRDGHRRRPGVPPDPPGVAQPLRGPPGPNAILVRIEGRREPAGSAGRCRPSAPSSTSPINGGSVLPVQRPAEILNYGSLGSTPLLLGLAPWRRARRPRSASRWSPPCDAGGGTWPSSRPWASPGGQLAGAIAVQASVAAVIGCAIGIPARHRARTGPLGSLRRPRSAPSPTHGAGGDRRGDRAVAFALAVLVATVPGRLAARTPTSQLLRTE